MRVLWFTNTSSCYQGQRKKGYNGGGWISSLECEIKKCESIELGICFYSGGVKEIRRKNENKTTYYLVPRPKKTFKYILRTLAGKLGNASLRHEQTAMPILLEVVSNFNPDVIHVFGSENIYGLIVKYTSIPVVLHIQGLLTPYLNAFLPPFISWKMYLWQDKSFLSILKRTSEKIAWQRNSITEQRMIRSVMYFMGRTSWDEGLLKVMNPKASYFHCDEMLRDAFYDKFASRQFPQIPTFVTTISSQPYKGYDVVLKAAKILKGVYGDFEWKVFGDISPQFIERKIGIMHGDVNVHLLGVATAEQIKDALLHSTIYVHTSYIDNSPNSLCEASILGIPSVATYVGGIPSLIENGRTGFLVPSNDPFLMASAMIHLVEHIDVNIAMGKASREMALKRHDRRLIAKKVIDIYKKITNDR